MTTPIVHKNHLVSLQILRAVAAGMVFCFHYFDFIQGDFGAAEKNLFNVGMFGVDVFFVISGFIICFASQREHSSGRFFVKRLCRILPLYYLLTLAIFFVALLAPQLLNSTTANVEELIKSYLFIPYERDTGRVEPLLYLGWTLNYEMFFYAVFALTMFAGKGLRIWLCCAVITALVAYGYLANPTNVIINFFTQGVMMSFVWGCLIYKLYKASPVWLKYLAPFWPVFFGLILIQNWFYMDLPREIGFGLPAALLVISLLQVRVPDGAVWRFFSLLGDASYSLYLVHPYVLKVAVIGSIALFGKGVLSIAIMTILSVVTTVVASILLFKLLEKPSNIWLRKRLLWADASQSKPQGKVV